MQTLVEDFLQYLRHERGQAEHTQKTYAGLLNRFTAWAGENKITDWKQVELKHLMAFLQHERERALQNEEKDSPRRLSSESVYLQIAALRAFYNFAETEKLLPANPAEHLSLPKRWKRLPKSLTNDEITQIIGVAPGYMSAGNAYFDLACTIPPAWNRAIFYDGTIFHSGHITAPHLLHDNPLEGRLTMNSFFRFRKLQMANSLC